MEDEFSIRDHAEMMLDDPNEIDIVIWGAMQFSKTNEEVRQQLTEWGKPEYFDKYYEKFRKTYPGEHPLKAE